MPTTLPFVFRSSDDRIGSDGISSTAERLDGLLVIDEAQLRVQWRRSRKIERVGLTEVRTDTETDPVGEVLIDLTRLGSAQMRRVWLRWPPGWYVALTARDLKVLEPLARTGGIPLDHPAELLLPVRRKMLDLAREFVAELNLAVADRILARAEESRLLPPNLERNAD